MYRRRRLLEILFPRMSQRAIGTQGGQYRTIPKLAANYALQSSKVSGVSLEKVLGSSQFKKYLKKVEERVPIDEFLSHERNKKSQ